MRRHLACLWLLVGLVLPSQAEDWPQFLGPNSNGISREKGLISRFPENGPTIVWRKKIGIGYSAPVVAGQRVVVFYRRGDSNVVECLDARRGESFWKFSYETDYSDAYGKGDGPRSTPTIAADKVYTLSAEGILHCLGLRDGTKIWQRHLLRDYQVPRNFFGVGTSPIVEGNLLLINVGGKGAGIVAFDKNTGKEVWKVTDDGASYASPVAATIDGQRHVFFFTRRGLVSIAPQTGKVRFSKYWRPRINASVNAANPVVAGDLVFVSTSYDTGALVVKVSRSGADEVWKGDGILTNHYNTSIHHDGYLYGIDGRQERGARLRCIELKTGKVQWTKEGFGCGSIIFADDKLIILTEQGELVLVEATPKAYRELARAQVLSPTRSQIALANGLLYARDDEKILCIQMTK
ncbi:MAG: alcohol dehydrogenase [Gemmatales bacterium]|nr:MAG: alcohol dehydrogenase [Gemmatales bacterium]